MVSLCEGGANYLEDPDHLIAVSSRANRSKGARGPEGWKPFDETYWCRYAVDWAEIKAEWELTMTEPEANAVVEMLGTCEVPVRVVSEKGDAVLIPTPEPHQGPVYGSCEEAEEAGEQRVQRSQGEDRVSRRRWYRAPGTGMVQCARNRWKDTGSFYSQG